ncbi:MAG: ATP-binding cassette domain-containing protein [Rhodospirillales bacterium]|nr:ATP-binding cassette domain-containing protein [Rhodospirillales bacterium]
MDEFLARLKRQPGLAGRLVLATLLANLLALAQPLFTIQVLNRYVAHGVDSTLATLTIGVVIAIGAEYLFRQLRNGLSKRINDPVNEEITLAGLAVLAQAKLQALESIPAGRRRELVGSAAEIEGAFNASNLSALLDLPFSLIFIIVLFLLSPVLGLVTLAFIAALFLFGLRQTAAVRTANAELKTASGRAHPLLETAIREADTVHVFNAQAFMRRAWFEASHAAMILRGQVADRQATVQGVSQTGTALLNVAIYAVGALLVVAGKLDVGMMIGASILSSRALQPTTRFAQIGGALARAKQALRQLEEFARLPLEAERGTAKTNFSGRVELRDVAFFYPGASGPLFEHLSLVLEPGAVYIVSGNSGTGKTTLMRLFTGLLEPVRGQVLVDGIDLRQVAPTWWRSQIVYLPQEPTFLNASIADNLKVANPGADMARLNAVIAQAGLRRFLDESPKGFETPVIDNGRQLAVGVRRALALARALMSDGRLVLIDEMFDGFDGEGRAAISAAVNRLAQEQRTVLITSHRANSMEGIRALIDLNQKPEPRIVQAVAKSGAALNLDGLGERRGAERAANG